jgi:hypothetical protein
MTAATASSDAHDRWPNRGWLTTGDLARLIDCTPRGARWIATQAGLACERTPGGYRLFRESDVLRLVRDRARARLRGVTRLRARKRGRRDGPRQLALFTSQPGSTSRGNGGAGTWV